MKIIKAFFSSFVACTLLFQSIQPMYIYADEIEDVVEEDEIEDTSVDEDGEQIIEEEPVQIEEEVVEQIVEEEQESQEEQTVYGPYEASYELNLKDRDELASEYVESLFYEDIQEDASMAWSPQSSLPQYDQLYSEVLDLISKVASGQETHTQLTTSVQFSNEEIGITSNMAYGEKIAVMQEITSKIITEVLKYFRYHCPTALYWAGTMMYTTYFYEFSDTTASITNFVISIPVNADYAVEGVSFEVNPTKINRAIDAIANAKSIIQQASFYASEVAQMNFFKNVICDLVDYNHPAVDDNWSYGDAWQLVDIFDGDPTTKVVCEGYAKAFKYLCASVGIDCIIVTGDAIQQGDSERHMWNIVCLDGQNYHVDITWCDEGGNWFLLGGQGSVENGYTISISERSAIYKFDQTTLNLFTEDQLRLSSTNYSVQNTDPSYQPTYQSRTLITVTNNTFVPGETKAMKYELLETSTDGTTKILDLNNVVWGLNGIIKRGWNFVVDENDSSILHVTAPSTYSADRNTMQVSFSTYIYGQKCNFTTLFMVTDDYYSMEFTDLHGNVYDEAFVDENSLLLLQTNVIHTSVNGSGTITREPCGIEMLRYIPGSGVQVLVNGQQVSSADSITSTVSFALRTTNSLQYNTVSVNAKLNSSYGSNVVVPGMLIVLQKPNITFTQTLEDQEVESGETFNLHTQYTCPDYVTLKRSYLSVSKDNGQTWQRVCDVPEDNLFKDITATADMDGWQYKFVLIDKNGLEFSSNAATITVIADKVTKIEGYHVSLSGKIGVNFHAFIAESLFQDPNAKAVITLPDGTKQTTYLIDIGGSPEYYNGGKCYMFTCYVSAKDMTSNINIQFVDGDGNELYSDDFTVEDYANAVIQNVSMYGENNVAICKAMLTYGRYVQQYFNYNTNKLPSTANSLQNIDLSQYAYELTDNNPNVDFVGARLVLKEGCPSIKLYFIGDGTFYLPTHQLQTEKEGKYTVVTINNTWFMTYPYTITCEGLTLNYSVASYGNIALNGNNTDLKNLIKAMYAYFQYFYN